MKNRKNSSTGDLEAVSLVAGVILVLCFGMMIFDLEAAPVFMTLVIEGKSFDAIRKEQQESWESLTIPEHMEHYLSQGMDKKTAMKQVAKDRGVGKREIYQALLEEE